jgi:hypothetical protein
MLKTVKIFMTMSLFLGLHVRASDNKIHTTNEQYETFFALTQTRSPDAPFPELLTQFETNTLTIRQSLGQKYLEKFDLSYHFSKNLLTKEGGTTLCRFNMAYHLYAYFLKASQLKEDLDPLEIERRQSFIEKPHQVTQNAVSFETQEATPAKIAFAAHRDLYPYTIVSSKGLFSLELLNKSFAQRRPLCGLPLEKSSYDGGLHEDSDRFLTHDWRHVYLRMTHWIGLDTFLKAYKKLYDLVETNQESSSRAQDHLVLFYMMHEGYNSLTDTAAICDSSHSGISSKTYMSDPFDFKNSCKKTLFNLSKRIQKCTLSFKDQHDPFFKIALTPKQESTSVTDIVETYGFSKSCALYWGDPQDWADKPKLGWASNTNKSATGVYMGAFGFDDYNQLFDAHSMLKSAGLDFKVWKEGTFNSLEMNNIFTLIVNNFESRYKIHFED